MRPIRTHWDGDKLNRPTYRYPVVTPLLCRMPQPNDELRVCPVETNRTVLL